MQRRCKRCRFTKLWSCDECLLTCAGSVSRAAEGSVKRQWMNFLRGFSENNNLSSPLAWIASGPFIFTSCRGCGHYHPLVSCDLPAYGRGSDWIIFCEI